LPRSFAVSQSLPKLVAALPTSRALLELRACGKMFYGPDAALHKALFAE